MTLRIEQDGLQRPGRGSSPFADATAIGLSGLCMVHCLTLPLVAASLPLLGIWAQAEWIHWAFVGLAAPVSIFALSRPRRGGPPSGLLVLTLIGVAALIAGVSGWPSRAGETALTVIGSITLIAVHLLNRRWTRAGL